MIKRPVFWIAELLHGCGIDPYRQYESRIRQIIDIGYSDPTWWDFVRRHRFD